MWAWVTRDIAPGLLDRGVRVARCHDLDLVGRILVGRGMLAPGDEPEPVTPAHANPAPGGAALFDADEVEHGEADDHDRLVARLDRQLAALDRARDGGALRVLVRAESAGALCAAEMRHAGLPFSVDRHEEVLLDVLGPRGPGGRPVHLEEAGALVRAALGDPRASLDSPRELVRALRRAGLDVETSSKWELWGVDHPVVEPLMRYRHLYRLLTANGWAWRADWVHDGRFRPEYVPGGVVTGRWATSGGGALQLPREIRSAAVADPGWKLVVADAAQLEPRILAAMSGDVGMARAGAERDMYLAFVERGVVPDRDSAKVALLGAMYGSTTGRSATLLPSLERAFPRAMATVAHAARQGERGEQVATWLGRTSPDAAPGVRPRDHGRFTRNFIVQGTAAEWALVWLAGLRFALARLTGAASPAGAPLESTPHLCYFLHDEVVVHTPERLAERVSDTIRQEAERAGRLLFGNTPVSFPVSIAIVDDYGAAKGS
ncbi:bifunctional 3'-5' exonuclease/DNA polymerase [Pseudoclavibacter chungangensis]|uniref:DNA-directed DNA polymerase n=1 Tax=Pseudoclavibacter chungangensis TaxID=587635 RepID=A0A7J5C1I1_9MICO|nr:bifunctional 3'-5' exonuclease/DNA polymerase [Pseudoclavibacter chungangensis]NYJ68516.1 DNA polymerase-1 [Pseudoclavibacter chungangensis]